MSAPMKQLWHTTSLLQVFSSLHSKFTTLHPWSPLLGLHFKLVRSGPVNGYWPLLLLLHLGFDLCSLSCVAHGKTSSWKLSLSKKVCNFVHFDLCQLLLLCYFLRFWQPKSNHDLLKWNFYQVCPMWLCNLCSSHDTCEIKRFLT